MKKIKYFIVLFFAIAINSSCKKTSCDYLEIKCSLVDSLNLSSGIDKNGNLLTPGIGVVDPFWKLLNNPPLVGCTNALQSTINGSGYVVNYNSAGANIWINQPTAVAIAPVNVGNAAASAFSCNNPKDSLGQNVPYIFERSFCVLKNTIVKYNFTFKGDDQVFFTLFNNNTNTILSTSSTYTYPGISSMWSSSALALPAGSYSVRAHLVNVSGAILGFTFAGAMKTTNGDLAISNNNAGCCENNTISIFNVTESNCNDKFDATDNVGGGFVFNLKNSAGTIIKTATTDINGNIFFSGLADGNYTIQIIPKVGWVPHFPTGGSTSVTVTNNEVKVVNFFNCP
jgi:Prealbumin-like fold domain